MMAITRRDDRIFVVGVIAASVCATAAAQTATGDSLAIYGSLDAGAARVSNLLGHSIDRLDGGTTQPDRFGIRGSEDLGGGLKASFLLESGFSINNGTPSNSTVFFNRNSSVSLGGPLGTLVLGHLPTLIYDWVGKTSNGFQLSNLYAFHPGNFDTLSNNFQFDNAVRYNTPESHGVTAGAVYGFGDSTASSPTGHNLSAGIHYLEGPLRIAAAYSIEDRRTLKNFATFAAASHLPANGVMDQVRNSALGAVYKFSQTGVNAVLSQTEMRVGSAKAHMRNLDLGLSQNISQADIVNAGASMSTLGSTHWATFSLMNMYSFSKRTQAYLQVTAQRASSGQAAILNAVGVSSNNHLCVTSAGLHQSF